MSSPTLENPFVGLRPFESNESLLFFGRHEQTVALLERLHDTRFLAVVGSSGCGKSSLVRAGLLPKLEAGFLVEDLDRWAIATMKPGDAPISALARSIVANAGGNGHAPDETSFANAIRREGVAAIVEHLKSDSSRTNLLLLVDQFEEIFRFQSVGDEASEREAFDFVSIMLELTAQREFPIYVVMTMRSDFVGECDAFTGLPEAMNCSQYLVPRLSREQRREAIVGPICLFGAGIEPALVDRLLNDAGDASDDLPVLQHAMMRTWSKWNVNGAKPIALRDYQAVGTVTDALSKHAEEALAGMTEQERDTARRLFQALTETDAGNRRVRRPTHLLTLEKITGQSRADLLNVIERFRSDGRAFLVLSGGGENPLVDISHESLIRQWKRLRDWTDEEAQGARIYRRLAETAVLNRTGNASLLSDPELQLALAWREQQSPTQAWADRYHPAFALAIDFLERSKAKRQRDAEAERARKVRGFALTLGAAILAAVAALLYANSQRADAVLQGRLLTTALEQKQSVIMDLLPTKPVEGLAYAIQATGLSNEAYGSVTSSIQSALRNAVETSREKNRLSAPSAGLGATVAMSQRGEVLARVVRAPDTSEPGADPQTRADVLRLWDLTGRVLREIEVGTSMAAPVAIASDGSLLVTAQDTEHVGIWRSDGTLMGSIAEESVRGAFLAPSGDWLATISSNGIALWDTSTLQEIARITTDPRPEALTFSPDGQFLIYTADKNVHVWDTTRNLAVAELQGHSYPVHALAVSHNGTVLASGNGFTKVGSVGAEIRIWDLSRFELSRIIPVGADEIRTLAFSMDDELLFAGVGERIQAWDRSGHEVNGILAGHSGPVTFIEAASDGKTLVSGSEDGTIRFWDLSEAPRGRILRPEGSTNWATFGTSPDEVVVAEQGGVTFWDLSGAGEDTTVGVGSGLLFVQMSPQADAVIAGTMGGLVFLNRQGVRRTVPTEKSVWATSVAPDRSYVLAGGDDGQLLKLDWEGDRIAEFSGQSGSIWSVDHSPDGRTIVSSGREAAGRAATSGRGSLALWEPSGKMVRSMTGLPNVNAVKFVPDRRMIVSGDDEGRVRFWALDGTEKRQFAAHSARVIGLDVSSDGALLATGGSDQMIRIWRADGTLLVQFHAHEDWIHSVEFSDDGRWLVSSSMDKTVRTWPQSLWSGGDWRTLLGVACARLRDHPMLADGSSALGLETCLTCEAYVWNTRVCSTESASATVRVPSTQLWAPATR